MRDNCSTRLYSSTSVIKRKTLRSVIFILLTIFLNMYIGKGYRLLGLLMTQNIVPQTEELLHMV